MYFAAGRCQLQATVRSEEVESKAGESPEMVYQTQLELLCSSTSCPAVTNFTTCDIYNDLNIPRGTESYTIIAHRYKSIDAHVQSHRLHR